MRLARTRTIQAVTLVGVILIFFWQAVVSADEPLRVEDVVRRFVQGESVASLLEQIRGTTVDFILDDEMRQELEIAGIPIELINAMAARQEEMAPEPLEDDVDGEDGQLFNLQLRLNPPRKPDTPHVSGGSISLQTLIERRVADQLGLNPDQTHFDDLAAYVLCRTPDHVPDRWRSQSPLGRDFQGSRRHRMLLFHAGAETAAKALVLQLPMSLELRLDEAVGHRLTVGVAGRVEENYLNLTAVDLDDLLITDGETVTILLRMENAKSQPLLDGLLVKRINGTEQKK